MTAPAPDRPPPMTANATAPQVRFLRIVGIRSSRPQILAAVDDVAWVEWNPRRQWTCTCTAPDGAFCDHVDAVVELLDPRVTTPPKTRPTTLGGTP